MSTPQAVPTLERGGGGLELSDAGMGLRFFGAHDGDDQFSRTRLAIARAAAAIGRAIRTQQCGRPHDPPYQGSAS